MKHKTPTTAYLTHPDPDGLRALAARLRFEHGLEALAVGGLVWVQWGNEGRYLTRRETHFLLSTMPGGPLPGGSSPANNKADYGQPGGTG